MASKRRMRTSAGSCLYDFIIYLAVGLFALACFIPFLYVLTFSITPYEEYLRNPINIFPRNITFTAYRDIFKFRLFVSGFKNTLFITIVSTMIHMLLLVLSAYPLSKGNLKGRKFLFWIVLFTMFFNGGIIPSYYLISKLHLINNLWALILPVAIGAYPVILLINFFRDLPEELSESAFIDGANDLVILVKIILPVSVPALVTLALFHAVYQWNSFFHAVLYTPKQSLWPLQLVLRELVTQSEAQQVQSAVMPFTIKMAAIMSAMLPMVCAYPFAQKYFMKGLLMGSVKG